MKRYELRLIDMLQNQITARGMTTPAILEAMQRAPRHLFVPDELRHAAYEDHPLNLPADRSTISQPYMVAYMADALACEPQHRVLEIGAGSGYQAAVLSYLCAQVYTVERYENLVQNAIQSIQSVQRDNVNFKIGDGLQGWPEHAPFDRIIVTAAAKKPPRALAEQLTMGGLMLIPLGDSQIQTLTRIQRTEDGYKAEALIPCVFVPLVSDQGDLTEIENHDWIEIVE
ncbi:MAG: protein-L-isoaspartate(D-aspartate) O-methyltransferase [Candidatus Hinthialibacter antarcticus]|nr:protein-L-isoaspartate(D-aspartate) O-methyltransferase [Candidatus Hinthialibacter antarcticus]